MLLVIPQQDAAFSKARRVGRSSEGLARSFDRSPAALARSLDWRLDSFLIIMAFASDNGLVSGQPGKWDGATVRRRSRVKESRQAVLLLGEPRRETGWW